MAISTIEPTKRPLVNFKFPTLTRETFTNAYDSFLFIIDFFVTRTAESMATILIKALPMLAPFPNAVSLWHISQQEQLHYNVWQAYALAGCVEGMFFAITEVVLRCFDGYLKDKERFKIPLGISIGVFVGYFAVIMWIVSRLENNIVSLAFPVVSLFAAVFLGVDRWIKRNENKSAVAIVKPTIKAKTPDKIADIEAPTLVVIEQENLEVNEEETADKTTDIEPDKAERHAHILVELKAYTGKKINKTQLAKAVGVHPATLRKDLIELEGQGKLEMIDQILATSL